MRFIRLGTLALFAITLPAATIYQIDFTGKIGGGTIRALTNTQQNFTVDLIPDSLISGRIRIDLSAAPAPVDSLEGELNLTKISQSTGPAYVDTTISFTLPALPVDALLIDSTYRLIPDPAAVDATSIDPVTSSQETPHSSAPQAAAATACFISSNSRTHGPPPLYNASTAPSLDFTFRRLIAFSRG